MIIQNNFVPLQMWKFNNKYLRKEDIPEDALGFIYKITRKSDGKIYIGKKVLSFSRKKRLTKKEKLEPENKRKTFKRVTSISDWESYWGSSKELKEDINLLGLNEFEREIILFCKDKRELTYQEVKHQFLFNVLEINSYNGNILSRFFRIK